MAEELENEVKATVKRKGAAAKEPRKVVTLHIGDAVKYKGDTIAVITGFDKTGSKLYLDTPVCAWVPMSDCKLA